jgi:hypothetical protein
MTNKTLHRIDNTMAKRKRQTKIYKTLHRRTDNTMTNKTLHRIDNTMSNKTLHRRTDNTMTNKTLHRTDNTMTKRKRQSKIYKTHRKLTIEQHKSNISFVLNIVEEDTKVVPEILLKVALSTITLTLTESSPWGLLYLGKSSPNEFLIYL